MTNGPGEGMLITLLHKVVKKCSGIEGRKAQQSASKPSQDADKLVLTAIVGETSRLMSHRSRRNMDGVQQVGIPWCNSLKHLLKKGKVLFLRTCQNAHAQPWLLQW